MARKKCSVTPTKMIHVRLTDGVHRKLKVEVAKQGLTVQDWVSTLVESELKKSHFSRKDERGPK